jgi:F-type H+-transporting ATPase subunit gamma
MQATRPYAKKISQIIRHLAHANPEYKHPFLIKRDVKRIGLIIISSDRGLCGGLNSNLFRKVVTHLKQWEKSSVEVDICAIGSKGANFFAHLNVNLVAQKTKLSETVHQSEIFGLVRVMLNAYDEKRIDELYLVNNEFVNTMTQKPLIERILPVVVNDLEDDLKGHWDYIYEPDAKAVLDNLLTRYIESMVYQGLVENNACEQAARMVAMKSASDNAGNLIKELQLIYNKARQAAITQEISEIVAGAAAV